MIDTPQSMGGVKRAESLPPEKRQAIARQAALARWQPNRAPIDPNGESFTSVVWLRPLA
jgi:hypothetical protein